MLALAPSLLALLDVAESPQGALRIGAEDHVPPALRRLSNGRMSPQVEDSAQLCEAGAGDRVSARSDIPHLPRIGGDFVSFIAFSLAIIDDLVRTQPEAHQVPAPRMPILAPFGEARMLRCRGVEEGHAARVLRDRKSTRLNSS